jgi:AcrR family transcriptional regulator
MEKVEKREAILQAALELIAELGFQHTPMSLIAKRAHASAGIIYHYFESKEELIQVLYRRVKTDLSRALLAVDVPDGSLEERFRVLWTGAFRYCVGHPNETVFLEQYESLPVLKVQEEIVGEEMAKLNKMIEEMSGKEAIKVLPYAVINELTFGVALKLARQVTAGQLEMDEEMLGRVAGACWDAIAS